MGCLLHGTVSLLGMKIPALALVMSTVLAGVVALVIWGSHSWTMREKLRQKAARRREKRREQVESMRKDLEENGVLVTEERERISGMSVRSLLAALKEGNLRATDVLHAFQAKAIEATAKSNCVTEFFPEAEEWAKQLDSVPADKRGPLFGLPVSVKDNYHVRGHDTTLGIAKRLGCPQEATSTLVQTVRRLGAIPFCKTNVPQTLLSFGCENPIFGETHHPTHKDRTPGGSSGGEGSLIALGGSPLGLGSDIGGSVRIPAAFCGVTGLKPTGRRFSYKDVQSSVPHLPGILVTVSPGLMARDVDDVVVVVKAVLQSGYMQELDPTTVPLPWRDQIFSGKQPLRIGICSGMPYFPPSPGMQRATEEARIILERAGHKLIPISLPDGEEVFQTCIDILMSDGGARFLELWKHESIARLLITNKIACLLPAFVKRAIRPIVALVSQRTALSLTAGTRAMRTVDLWEVNEVREKLIRQVTEQWRHLQIDACVMPALPFPAVGPRHPSILFSGLIYTLVFNLLDFPCGVVKMTTENSEDQAKLDKYGPPGDGDLVFRVVRKTLQGAEGLPLSVQVASFPWQEETVLRVMRQLQEATRT